MLHNVSPYENDFLLASTSAKFRQVQFLDGSPSKLRSCAWSSSGSYIQRIGSYLICKRGNKNHWKPMTCWCGVLEDEVPVRIIASKLEELCEKQTWKGTKYFSTDVFHLNFGFKEQHQFWSQKRQLKKIYLYSLITHSLHKLGGGSIANMPRLVVWTFSGFPGSGWLRGMAMLLPKSLTPFTFGDRVKPLVERDGQVEEGNLSRVWVSKLKTSDKALISQRGNTCLNRFRIQTMDFSAKYLKTIRGFFIIF